jgi:hypothetical protein
MPTQGPADSKADQKSPSRKQVQHKASSDDAARWKLQPDPLATPGPYEIIGFELQDLGLASERLAQVVHLARAPGTQLFEGTALRPFEQSHYRALSTHLAHHPFYLRAHDWVTF